MILRLLLLAAFVAAPAAAETIFPDPDWVGPPSSTEYDLVEEADRILLVRAVAARGGTVRFRIEESVKGEMGKVVWLHARSEAEVGSRHLVFLNRDEDEWVRSGFGFLEIEAKDEDWVEVLRLFSRIAVLDDDEAEAKALRKLREAALADPDDHPALLVRMIDQHFGSPTPDKPFSELVDLYEAAASDAERLNVLWALRHGEHPETAGFFRSLLLGGEPLWLMRPVLEWMSEGDNEAPLLKDLARAWLGHAGEDRGRLLDLMVTVAEPEDTPVLWSLLPSSSADEKRDLVLSLLHQEGPDGFSLPPDETLKKDLLLLWMETGFSGLEPLLRQDEIRDWRSVPRIANLVDAFEASRLPAERRQILMEVRRRTLNDLDVIWRLLRGASDGEAEVLLEWASLLDPPRGLLVDDYRGAADEEQRSRALWLLFAIAEPDEVEPLLSVMGALGEGSVRLERVARAFLTCPHEDVRFRLAAHLEDRLATAGDFLTMLRVLQGASLAEARLLAPWFARHPGPEALSILWRVPIPSLYEEEELAQALAAAGDSEVLDMALGLRNRLATENDRWAYAVLARSPLPAAQEEARRILEQGGHPRLQLLWEVEKEDNASPWREWYLREIAQSEDEALRARALTFLAKLSGDEPEP